MAGGRRCNSAVRCSVLLNRLSIAATKAVNLQSDNTTLGGEKRKMLDKERFLD
jgi:hypothetical protein